MTSTAESDNAARRVLVVEDRAHRPMGHFPTRFAELAEGFADAGCAVEVLTSDGWLFEGERSPFPVNRYGSFDRLLCRTGESMQHTRGLHRLAHALRTVGLVRAARSRCSEAGDPAPDVVVVSTDIDPLVGSAFARRGRWLFYEFGGPSRPLRQFTKRAARAESRRRAEGGRARVATPNADDSHGWNEVAPFLDPITLPIAGVRRADRVPDAKRRLGLNPHDRVAVVFGAANDDKDVDLVARVFAELADWQLVVAGRVADGFRQQSGGREAIIVGGYVDAAMRDAVYSAADLVVLSFTPDYQGNSEVLHDAISYGVPVVCSDGSISAAIVREYRLGVIFTPGDPDSLVRAVSTAPTRIGAGDLERARSDLSNRAVAVRFLRALLDAPPAGGGQP